jgi:hypothetical protein
VGIVGEQELHELGGPAVYPLPLELGDVAHGVRDDVPVEADRAHQQLSPEQEPDGGLEAEVRRDHALSPVGRRAQPLDVAAGGLPHVVVEEALLRAVDREFPELLLEVHAVQQQRLRLALLHRRLQRHAVRDRVGQRVAGGARESEPDAVLDERRHLQVLAQEVDPFRVEVREHALAARRPHGAFDQLLVAGARLVIAALPHLTGIAEVVPVGRAQPGRVLRPQPAAVLEVQRPAAVEVPVDGRLRVHRDVLVDRGPALLRRVPQERALRVFAAARLGRVSLHPLLLYSATTASAEVVNLSWKILLCSSMPCRSVASSIIASIIGGGPHM